MAKGSVMTSWVLIGLVVVSAATAGVSYFAGHRKDASHTSLSIQFAYPVVSIDPSYYDDWESVFIGNHIYPRLLPEKNRPTIPFITKELEIACETSNTSFEEEKCVWVTVRFHINGFKDCLGRMYTVEDIKGELKALLKSKSWALPDWSFCESKEDEICVRAHNSQDIERRLRNVNFRFGWSKGTKSDSIYGVGPYCLYSAPQKDGSFMDGLMKPIGSGFPELEFKVSQSAEGEFNLALYGSKNLLRKNRKNVQAHTPLAYYVITNPKWKGARLPWNSGPTKNLINSFLVEHEVFFSDGNALSKLVPLGDALTTPVANVPKTPLEFVVPDYLPECQKLASSLNTLWKEEGFAKATCSDIVSFAMEKVKGKKGTWDGFVVGVSASDPGRDSVRIQYFSPFSSDSWTYDEPSPEKFYYLVGMGQSIVTVDSEKICSIRPNPLGLGDIFVGDLLSCGGER